MHARRARRSRARMIAEDIASASTFSTDQGYAYANVLPLTKVDSRQAHGQPDVRGRARQARLLRAHQHPRQLQDARQGDPPRDEDLRGRAVQQHEPRGLQAPDQALGFFENVVVSTKRGSTRVRRGQRRGHRARHRHVPDRRRLLVGRELHRPGADLAEQPVRPRQDARAAGADLAACASCSCCASSSRTSSTPTDVRVRPLQPLLFYPSFDRNARGGTLTWGYLLGDGARAFRTYKLEDVDVQQDQAGRTIGGFGTDAPVAAGTRREPVPRRLHVVAAPVADVGLAQQPPVPHERLVPLDLRSSTPIRSPPRRRLQARQRLGALLQAAVGPVHPPLQRRGRPHDLGSIRSACRSASATSSAASTTSAATRCSRSARRSTC